MKLLLSAVLLAGCVDLVPDKDYSAYDDGDQTMVPTTPATHASGSFDVSTDLAITAEQLLPASGEKIVQTLRDFASSPGHALLQLADSGPLLAVIPDALESRVEGWIDDEMAGAKIGGVPVRTFAAQTVALAEQALTRMRLDSTLVLGAAPSHQLTRIAITVGGQVEELDITSLPTDVTSAALAVSTQGSTIHLGDHRFGLAYGSYAWDAIERAIVRTHGVDLRTLLGTAVNCPALAQRVAQKCVLDQCVGHATQIESICEAGLDEVVDQAHAQVESFRLDAIHFAAGTAAMIDIHSDGDADLLSGGAWTAEIDLGQGLRPATGSFTGWLR